MCDQLSAILNNELDDNVTKVSSFDNDVTINSVVLGETICYIVGAVLMNEKDEILLIQEAKSSLRGLWYLPAGRVEINETLQEAVKREVLEESGLHFNPTGLICVEERERWIRFTFAGDVCGGTLKTLKEADSESLQAKWCKDFESIQLRSWDIMRCINIAKDHYKLRKLNENVRKLNVLPLLNSFKALFVQSIILFDLNHEMTYLLLVQNETQTKTHLPMSYFRLTDNVKNTIDRTIKYCFLSKNIGSVYKSNIIGVLGVEHTGKSDSGEDGLCLKILVVVENQSSSNSSSSEASLPSLETNVAIWSNLDKQTQFSELLTHSLRTNLCVPLILKLNFNSLKY